MFFLSSLAPLKRSEGQIELLVMYGILLCEFFSEP